MLYTHRHPSRRHAELPLKGDGEMRAVLEAHFIIHVRRLALPVAEHLVCLVQPLPDEPLLGRKVAHLGEVTLEGGEAAPGVGGKFLQGHILRVVRFHKGQQVNLPRLVEVEQRGVETLVRIEQAINGFLHLQPNDFIIRLDICVRVREEREEQALQGWRLGQHDGGLADAPHVRGQRRLVYTAEKITQEASLKADADGLVWRTIRRVFQQLHLMVTFEEHVIARADGKRPSLVLHHHLARIDVDERVYRQAVLR